MVDRVIYYYAISTVCLLLRVHGIEQTVAKDDLALNFTISTANNAFICTPDGEPNLLAEVGSQWRISFRSSHYLNFVNCTSMTHHIKEDIERSNVTSSNENYSRVTKLITFTNNSEGPWLCHVYHSKDTAIPNMSLSYIGNTSYAVQECRFNITLKGTLVPQEKQMKIDPTTLYYIGAGIIFIVIIVIQTAVIIYFKKKTKRVARIETLSQQKQNTDDNDNKRYSATPRQNRTSIARFLGRKSNKDENGIYETLEELQMSSLSPPTPPIETIPSLKRKKATENDISKRPPLPLPLTETPKLVEAKLPPPLNPKPKVPKNRAEVTTNAPAPVSSVQHQTAAKQFPASPNVASELDSLFKKRQNKSIAPSSNPLLCPAGKNVAPRTMPPRPKTDKASTTPVSNTLPSASVREKKSLPEYKTDFVKEQSEPQEFRVPFPPSKPQPMVPKKPHPKPVSPSPRPMPKKPVPPLPTPSTTHKPPQPFCPIPTLPNATPKPLQQEPVYEEYEEEPDYSDDEWTYESLPQYNIYSS